MRTDTWEYVISEKRHCGFLALPSTTTQPQPAIILAHDWRGRSEFIDHEAQRWAQQGYVACALDLYGEGRIGNTLEEKQALMLPLLNDRKRLQQQLLQSIAYVAALPQIDASRMVMQGFCFGGLCALDAVRAGANLRGAISVHGLLQAPSTKQAVRMSSKVLALHGYDDPMVPPAQVAAFAQEMTDAGVDWQLHAFGGVKHAFTNPEADNPKLGLRFDALASERAWTVSQAFVHECIKQ